MSTKENINFSKAQNLLSIFQRGVEGAFPNGTKVIKISSEKNDFATDGDTGTIIGSMLVPLDVAEKSKFEGKISKYLYLINWDHDVTVSTIAIDLKIDKYDKS